MLKMANEILVLLAVVSLPGCPEAYSRGAPDSQCRYMTPKHGFQPQNSDAQDDIPAWIQVSPDNDFVCMLYAVCRMVRVDSTPEIEVFDMPFLRQ